MHVTVLQDLARLGGETGYMERIIGGLAALQLRVAQHPLGFGQWLVALDGALAMPVACRHRAVWI